MARYKGFSSQQYEQKGTFLLTDVELVKYDLLNHIFTRKGERVRQPGFGTIIPDLTFELIDELLIDTIYRELQRVVNYDPRLELLSLNVEPRHDENAVFVNLRVRYVELNVVGNINFNIEFTEA